MEQRLDNIPTLQGIIIATHRASFFSPGFHVTILCRMPKIVSLIRGTACCALLVLSAALCTGCGLPYSSKNGFLSPQEHIDVGVAYENLHDFDGAEKEYRVASRDIPIAYLYLGNIYFQRGMFDEAEKAYRKAIDKTHDPNAYNNLAWLYYSGDVNLDEAERLAQAAVAMEPENEEFGDALTKIRERRVVDTLKSGLKDEKK